MTSKGPSIEIVEITRRFGRAVAVDGASVTFAPGEIHAVVGENGAGKSTLLKLAAGMLEPTSGAVKIGGSELRPATPAEAARRNVRMVHQHFMLVGAFTALENLLLGNEAVSAGGVLDLARARSEVDALAKRTGLAVPLDTITDALGVGDKQRLEILRVLHRGAEAILLDEPTAVLTPLEANDLYATLRSLADEGRTIVVVTHRLDEVVRFADRVTVMRRGKTVLSRALSRDAGMDVEELTRAIMGQEPPPAFAPPAFAADAAPALSVERLAFTDASGRAWLEGVDLSVKRGEIVGVAGVEGNGQRELVHAIAGLLPTATGVVKVAGRMMPWDRNVARALRSRRSVLRVVHEDRHAEGLLLDGTVADNLVLGALREIARADEASVVARRISSFGVVPADPTRRAIELSGGNQQKIVVARALDAFFSGGVPEGGAVVLAQPTRGVDVGAAAAIHAAIGRAAEAGLGVLVVSADLSELRTVCHRLVVIHKGRIVAELPPTESEETIGRAMLGLSEAA
ncbi:MAG: ATP-binding cassette domain-containing protein [Polyangiaceae bacterium]